MPYLLIFCSLFLLSCKNDHSLGTGTVTAVAEKSFITITHPEGESEFRNKLLNQVVEEKFPTDKPEFLIKNYDELKDYPMDKRDLGLYMEKERFMSKLIVSFVDRLEIYFLPRRVLVNEIIPSFHLRPDEGRVFKWLEKNHPHTVEGTTLYLVSLNHEDLMENDKKFYSEVFHGENLSFKSPQDLEVTIGFNFYKESITVQTFTGKKIKCSRDMLEAGMCGTCEYQRAVASGRFEKISRPPVDELGVRVKMDGESYPLSVFVPEYAIDNSEIKLSLKAHDSFALEKIPTPLYQQVSNGFNHQPSCLSNEGQGMISLQSKAEIKVQVKLLGRGERLKVIEL